MREEGEKDRLYPSFRYLQCQKCGVSCLDATISAHIYQVHINDREAVKCPYCEYSLSYAVAEIKRHITRAHPGKAVKIVDRRPALQVGESLEGEGGKVKCHLGRSPPLPYSPLYRFFNRE